MPVRSLLNWLKKAPKDFPLPTNPKLSDMIKQAGLEKSQWVPHRFTADQSMSGKPLAQALYQQFPLLPRSYFNNLVARHEVQVERSLKPIAYHQSMRVKEGDVISVIGAVLPEQKTREIDWGVVESIPEDPRALLRDMTIYEDERLLVLNKPSGLSLQPSGGVRVSLQDVLASQSQYFLVHRLEREASGLLLVAKDPATAKELKDRLDESQIDSSVEMIYWAMVCGRPNEPFGECLSSIYCQYQNRMTSHMNLRRFVEDQGKPALCQWRHLGTYVKKYPSGRRVKLSMLEMRLITNRKDQLRVQCAEQLRLPMVGDGKYGLPVLQTASVSFRPLHLHCYQVRIKDWHGQDLKLTAPIPDHFIKTMAEYPLLVPKKPGLLRPKIRSNVRPVYQRFTN